MRHVRRLADRSGLGAIRSVGRKYMTNPSTDHSDFPLRHSSVSAARLTLLGLLALLAAGSVVNRSMAAFSLNWQRDYNAEGASFSCNVAFDACNMSYISDANCGSGGFGCVFN